MSDDDRLMKWEPGEPGERALGRLCPHCGAPLRDHEAMCPACGTGAAPDAERPAGLLTPFGYGLCGLIGVGMLGFGISVGLVGGVPRTAVVLGPVVAAVVAAITAANVGRRLSPQWRCSYEHLLLGGMIGGPCALAAALLGLTEFQSLVVLWAFVAGAVFLLMRRYGYRHASFGG